MEIQGGKRAEQRIRLMQLAQPTLQPSPRCLDAPPAGAMQRCHRESVVQFINEVCEDFGLQTQTAGLAVSYFDRFLSKVEQRGLDKHRVQLLAITCTLIAAKFSEIKMPGLDDLCEVAHNKYTKEELKEMELETLRMLQWELHAVTPHAALEQLAIIINHTDERFKPFLEHAEFFIDMSYYEYKTLNFPPLVIASSALLCAWGHLGNVKALQEYLPRLSALVGVREHELLRCKTVLQDYFKATFPKAAEAAEMHRQASLAAGRESPDSIMTMSHDVAPDHAKQTAMPIDSAPEFCFSPVR